MAWIGEDGNIHRAGHGLIGSAAPHMGFAPGGRLKRGKMIIAHFNPHELNALDHWQGKRETCPRTGMRSYAHLEELLKNPHILRSLVHKVHEHHMHRTHHARGGHLHDYHDAGLNKMADQGIHGDTEVALIGPHTKQVFDHLVQMTHHPLQVNPHTGHPHYGFLDSIISGIGSVLSPVVDFARKIPLVGNLIGGVADMIGGGVKKLAPSLPAMAGNLAQQYLPQLARRYGGETMGKYANQGLQFMNQRLQEGLTPEQQQQGQEMAQRVGQMGQSAYDAYNRGGIREMGGDVIRNIGQQAGGRFGDYANQIGQGIQQNRNPLEMARDLGGQGIRDIGGQIGGEFGGYADQIGQGIQQHRNPLEMARDIGQQALNARLPERLYNRGGRVSY